MLFISVKL